MNRLASEAQPKTLEAEILDSVVDRWLVEGGDVLRTAHGHEHDVRATTPSERKTERSAPSERKSRGGSPSERKRIFQPARQTFTQQKLRQGGVRIHGGNGTSGSRMILITGKRVDARHLQPRGPSPIDTFRLL